MFNKLFMRNSIVIVFIFIAFSAFSDDKEFEIRKEMWNTKNKDFLKKDIPEKWINESAVIIATLNRFEYKKIFGKLIIFTMKHLNCLSKYLRRYPYFSKDMTETSSNLQN